MIENQNQSISQLIKNDKNIMLDVKSVYNNYMALYRHLDTLLWSILAGVL